MSRHITVAGKVKVSQEDRLKCAREGKLVITKYQEKYLTLLIRDNRLLAAGATGESEGRIGAVYLGKVKNMVKNINACFVEIANGELCFLPLSVCPEPFVLNRAFDGRLLEGDELLVQLEREALKTKQASVTVNINLTGRLCVLAVGSPKIGISGKISPERKKKLRMLLEEWGISDGSGRLVQEEGVPCFGMVVRTGAEALNSDQELLEEYLSLRKQLTELYRRAVHRTCYSCLLEAPRPYLAAADDFCSGEYGEAVTDLPEVYEELAHYIHVTRRQENVPVRLYSDSDYPLSRLYSIASRLQEALSPRIWLRSGAYLVIEPTEALTVIDVNTGKYDGRRDSKETFFQINKEAAQEICLQIRLRNLSGIIIVDFINMESTERQEELLQILRQMTRGDKVKTTVVDITPLGLVEITRKKKNKTLLEQLKQSI